MTPDPSTDNNSQQKAKLQALFDETLLDNGYITQFAFDLFHNTLSILVHVPLTEDEVQEHRTVFSSIRALVYQKELLFPPEAEEEVLNPEAGLP